MCLEKTSLTEILVKNLLAKQCLDMNSFTHVMACKINYKSNKQGSILVKYCLYC